MPLQLMRGHGQLETAAPAVLQHGHHPRSDVFTGALELALDWTDDEMVTVQKALSALVEHGAVARESVVAGAAELLEFFDSLVVDVPKADKYLSVLLQDVVAKKVYPAHLLPDKVAVAMGVDNTPPAADDAAGAAAGALTLARWRWRRCSNSGSSRSSCCSNGAGSGNHSAPRRRLRLPWQKEQQLRQQPLLLLQQRRRQRQP